LRVRAQVGTSEEADELLFEEPNELFWVGLDKTLDGKYVLIDSASKESSEVRAVDLSLPLEAKAPAVVLAPRRPKVLPCSPTSARRHNRRTGRPPPPLLPPPPPPPPPPVLRV
jgi:hypothetical protein